MLKTDRLRRQPLDNLLVGLDSLSVAGKKRFARRENGERRKQAGLFAHSRRHRGRRRERGRGRKEDVYRVEPAFLAWNTDFLSDVSLNRRPLLLRARAFPIVLVLVLDSFGARANPNALMLCW